MLKISLILELIYETEKNGYKEVSLKAFRLFYLTLRAPLLFTKFLSMGSARWQAE